MAPKSESVGDAVPVTAIAMKLLDVRLKPSGAIIQSAIGEFTATGKQEIVLLRAGGTIELHRIVVADREADDQRTFLKLVTRLDTHSVLRSCAVVRLSGGKRDIVAVAADGGAVSIIDFEGGRGEIVHCMVFGKTGKLVLYPEVPRSAASCLIHCFFLHERLLAGVGLCHWIDHACLLTQQSTITSRLPTRNSRAVRCLRSEGESCNVRSSRETETGLRVEQGRNWETHNCKPS